jgi:multidrug efflux system membrane fusion protein
MAIVLTGLGTVTPLASVTVQSQISGYLTAVAFREGQMVRKGDLLAQIDSRLYEAALLQYQGLLQRDQALLRNAQLDLVRYQKLNGQDSIARQTVDTALSTVRQYEGTVKYDEGMVETQRANLDYCRILAPIDGRVGLRQVDPGNYVTSSQTNGLVALTQFQPISVVFSLPEDVLPAVLKRVSTGARLEVTALDRNAQAPLATGSLEAVDNQVDTSTGTVKLRAAFANDNQALFPSQFVNIAMLVDTLRDAMLVPIAAVQQGAGGSFVYRLDGDNTVSVQAIRTGESDGTRIVVLSGVKAGDRVVVDGADRLKAGAPVRIPEPSEAIVGRPS